MNKKLDAAFDDASQQSDTLRAYIESADAVARLLNKLEGHNQKLKSQAEELARDSNSALDALDADDSVLVRRRAMQARDQIERRHTPLDTSQLDVWIESLIERYEAAEYVRKQIDARMHER